MGLSLTLWGTTQRYEVDFDLLPGCSAGSG
jgi:hypothetical protein